MQNKLSKIESQIQQLEKEIAKDDENLAKNYEKLMEDVTFFCAYEKKKENINRINGRMGNHSNGNRKLVSHIYK